MSSAVCPMCGDSVVVPDESAGRHVLCRRCRELTAAPPPVDQERPREPPPLPGRRPGSRDDRPRRRKPRVLVIVGIVLASVLFVCAGGAGLFYLVFLHEIDEPVTAADKEVMVTAEYAASFADDVAVDPNNGTYRKVRYLDRSREMIYEYGLDDDSTEPVHISHTVSVERNAKEARDAYAGVQFGTRIGIGRVEGIEEVERNDLWKWGDQSRCVILHNAQGQPCGNVFMGRKGRRHFLLVITGLYFDKAENIKAFLDPLLLKLDNYDG
jgi:hypothetical protein